MKKRAFDMASAGSIYALACVKTGEIRYIGKANNPDQRLKAHMKDSLRRDTPLYRWIRKHGQPELIIVQRNCEDWRTAERREILRLRAKGFRLLNVADGGDQPYCPTSVRQSNGKASAEKRSRVLWNAYRHMGLASKWLANHDRHETARKLSKAITALKTAERHARQNGTLARLEQQVADSTVGRLQ